MRFNLACGRLGDEQNELDLEYKTPGHSELASRHVELGALMGCCGADTSVWHLLGVILYPVMVGSIPVLAALYYFWPPRGWRLR